MTEERINKQGLMDRLAAWDQFLKRTVHLIACGGTAMTLAGVKASTKDIDLLVPDPAEYKYLTGMLEQLGYKNPTGPGWQREGDFIFDIFRGKSVHTTELLESPLEEGNNTLVKEFSHIYLGVLNDYDIIISKLFRATGVDIEDSLALLAKKKDTIDMGKLESRFKETASFDVSENGVIKNWEHFLRSARKEGLVK